MFSQFFLSKEFNQDENISPWLKMRMKENNISVISYAVIEKYEVGTIDSISINPNINIPISPLFQACSLSKSLTAFAILKLASEDKIKLDEPINNKLISWKIPANQYSDEITIRECLNMTSGLYYGDEKSTFPGYLQSETVPTLKNILNGTPPAHNPPIQSITRPGSQFYYSGASYMALQNMIEDVSGLSFANYMKNEILQPLHMDNSTFECPISKIFEKKIIPGFDADGKMNASGWENIVTAASGGLWSTSSDLAKFLLAIANAYLGKDNSLVSQTLANEIFNLSLFNFNLGFSVDRENFNIRKNGHNNGYHNEMLIFPHKGQGIVVMTNSAKGLPAICSLISHVGRKYHWPSYSLEFNEFKPYQHIKK